MSIYLLLISLGYTAPSCLPGPHPAIADCAGTGSTWACIQPDTTFPAKSSACPAGKYLNPGVGYHCVAGSCSPITDDDYASCATKTLPYCANLEEPHLGFQSLSRTSSTVVALSACTELELNTALATLHPSTQLVVDGSSCSSPISTSSFVFVESFTTLQKVKIDGPTMNWSPPPNNVEEPSSALFVCEKHSSQNKCNGAVITRDVVIDEVSVSTTAANGIHIWSADNIKIENSILQGTIYTPSYSSSGYINGNTGIVGYASALPSNAGRIRNITVRNNKISYFEYGIGFSYAWEPIDPTLIPYVEKVAVYSNSISNTGSFGIVNHASNAEYAGNWIAKSHYNPATIPSTCLPATMKPNNSTTIHSLPGQDSGYGMKHVGATYDRAAMLGTREDGSVTNGGGVLIHDNSIVDNWKHGFFALGKSDSVDGRSLTLRCNRFRGNGLWTIAIETDTDACLEENSYSDNPSTAITQNGHRASTAYYGKDAPVGLHDYCEDYPSIINEASDGKDNDGDGLTDELDETTLPHSQYGYVMKRQPKNGEKSWCNLDADTIFEGMPPLVEGDLLSSQVYFQQSRIDMSDPSDGILDDPPVLTSQYSVRASSCP